MHHGFLDVEEDLGNVTSQQGIYGYFRNQSDKTRRMRHASSHFEQFGVAAHGHGLLGVEEDLGIRAC